MTAADHSPVAAEARSRRSAALVSVRVLRIALWLMVIAGPVTAAWVATQVATAKRDLAALTIQVEASRPAANTSDVEGFAELAVADHLQAAHDKSDSQDSGVGDRPEIRTVTVGSEEVVPGYYAVTVAAGEPSSDVKFYTIGIRSTELGWAPTSRPSLVAAPANAPAPELAVSRMGGIDQVAGLEEALAGFLTALLAGDGDITRYAAPGSSLVPVEPPPFTSVEVTAAGSVPWTQGTQLVTAEVEGSLDDGVIQSLTYSVVFVERDSRWEVVELLAAAPLASTPDSEETEKVRSDD